VDSGAGTETRPYRGDQPSQYYGYLGLYPAIEIKLRWRNAKVVKAADLSPYLAEAAAAWIARTV
jgi:hypothetical protein